MSPCQVVVPLDPWSPKAHAGAGGTDHVQAGFYAPALGPFAFQRAVTPVANRAYLIRVVCPRSMTISKLGFVVQVAATADDPCDVGIYAANGTSLLGSAGSTLGRLNATGVKTVNLLAPIPLTQGQVYYAAFAHGAIGGTAAQLVVTDLVGLASSYTLARMFGGGPSQTDQNAYNTAFPLVDGFAGATNLGAANACPILALMQ